VKAAVADVLEGHPRIALTQPLDYLDLVAALRRADLVITDSGGIQEEAPTFGKPVLVLREVTERPEGVHAGIAKLVGTDARKILEEGSRILNGRGWGLAIQHEITDRISEGTSSSGFVNPYGDGRAGERIADIVVHALTASPRRTGDWEPPKSALGEQPA
jgi:UDP-N-acetylglucosamine 2-epimerase (non-hydrolysing)